MRKQIEVGRFGRVAGLDLVFILGDIVRRQHLHDLDRVDRALDLDQAVVDHIVSKCDDPDSGGRMIDNIITNTLLPSLSREFLKRSLAKETLKAANVTISAGDFSFAWQ